ncbi:DUF1549 domain-containing protein [bacterium]|nr:DUF1549 domain-containing protein [bacterium]
MRRSAILAAAAIVLGGGILAAKSFAGRPADAATRELASKIDAALEAGWREAGLVPAPAAPDLAFARRLSLDLLGTVPSLAEIRGFESEPEESRRERLIERVFSDPRFDEALAERLARIVVGAGKKQDDLFYRRRRFVDWLKGEVAKRRPWDDLVRELIAAEGTSTGAPAVNFVLASSDNNMVDPVKLAGRTARAFLGVRLDCAQCHDAPFSHWKQHEFEELSAFFARAKRGGPILFERSEGEYELHDRKDGKPRHEEPLLRASDREPSLGLAHGERARRAGGRARSGEGRVSEDPRAPRGRSPRERLRPHAHDPCDRLDARLRARFFSPEGP